MFWLRVLFFHRYVFGLRFSIREASLLPYCNDVGSYLLCRPSGEVISLAPECCPLASARLCLEPLQVLLMRASERSVTATKSTHTDQAVAFVGRLFNLATHLHDGGQLQSVDFELIRGYAVM